MPSGGRHRGPTPTSRGRAWAGAAVAFCLVADVWSVALAADDTTGAGPFSSIVRIAFLAGTGASTSTTPSDSVSEDVSEGVSEGPDGAIDSAESVPPTVPTMAAGAGTGTVVEKGTGRFTVVAVPAAAMHTAATGRTVRFTVEVEGGLPVDATAFATVVGSVLTDDRGWQVSDQVKFVNVSPEQVANGAKVDLRVTLASPDTTDALCAPLQTRGEVSCHNLHRAVLNLRRWQLGADAYGTDVAAYRTYLVNHEVGHGLGHGHSYCGGPGRKAPVMMQQTYGLKGCKPWPWPMSGSS